MGLKGCVYGVVKLLGELVEVVRDGGVLVRMEWVEFLEEGEGVGFYEWWDVE